MVLNLFFFAAKPREEINVTLPNGSMIVGKSWETTPAGIARTISKSLFEKTVIARVDGGLWDIERPLEKSCNLELLDFDNQEGPFSLSMTHSNISAVAHVP